MCLGDLCACSKKQVRCVNGRLNKLVEGFHSTFKEPAYGKLRDYDGFFKAVGTKKAWLS